MSQIKFFKVSALPSTLENNALYFVNKGEFVEQYVTGATGVARMVYSSEETNSLISSAIEQYNSLEIVDTIADRDAVFVGTTNKMALVNDASDDASVNSGAALYSYRGSDGAITKVSEYESLDLSLEWGNIVGRPASPVAAIDAAVASSHVHSNAATIDALTTVGGLLHLSGAPVASVWESTDW